MPSHTDKHTDTDTVTWCAPIGAHHPPARRQQQAAPVPLPPLALYGGREEGNRGAKMGVEIETITPGD
ncbi:unnamed protein product, partial [Pleuronectes platessa]